MACDNDKQLDEARSRMTRLASDLTKIFTPIDAAGILAGAAIALVAGTYGRAKAVEYLTELARDLDRQSETMQ